MVVTNEQFLQAIFGAEHIWSHVTDFIHDPSNIPANQHLIAWKGDYFSRYYLQDNTNQYFTISLFYCDDQQQARRRKALFRQTNCIVLDDVKEKLSMEEVYKLPQPSWILETSPGSEQWGYILNQPCIERNQVENLLDGLVANGLAPQGKDPGMKGVTRYVRLPGGVNNKANKLVNGQPFKCQLLSWQPFNTVTMEQLAKPFAVNLYAARRDQRIDGAAAVSDHPLINIPDVIQIKEIRSDGRFDVTCPWVSDHTGMDDSGAAVFTNSDGTIGFKCHHGACQHRTGADLLRYVESIKPGWMTQLKQWQLLREMEQPVISAPPISFLEQPVTTTHPQPELSIQSLCDDLRRQIPGTHESREAASKILKFVDDLPVMERNHWHDIIRDIMRWSQTDFKEIIKDLRSRWYEQQTKEHEFYDHIVFVRDLNQFYDFNTQIFYSAEGFQNSFSDQDTEVKKIALQEGRVKKVDRLDYAPKSPRIFNEGKIELGNMWTEHTQPEGIPGDVFRWVDHFRVLGWSDQDRQHVEKWMAFTLRKPEYKINHMILLGSREGGGKDWLLEPLNRGMAENGRTIDGRDLLADFDEHLMSCKYLHINETELGDHKEAMQISNKLKPLAAAPPRKLSVNRKGVNKIWVRNIVNATMTTNSTLPLRLNGPSRRFFALWSDINTRNEDGQMRQEWIDYWDDRWTWMRNGGWKNVLYYLMNDIDISDFNPGAAPRVTDFLKDIQESSKSPLLLTIEAFIKKGTGVFSKDLVTAQDIYQTLMIDGQLDTGNVFCNLKHISPVTVGRAAATSSMITKMLGRPYKSSINLYVIRNVEKYHGMNGGQLYREYERQMEPLKKVVT